MMSTARAPALPQLQPQLLQRWRLRAVPPRCRPAPAAGRSGDGAQAAQARDTLRALLTSSPPGRGLRAADAAAAGLGGAVQVEEALAELLTKPPQEHKLDSYAVRHLVLATPTRFHELSSLLVDSSTFVSRCAVIAAGGEEAVLTLTLQRTGSAAPPPPAPGNGSLHSADQHQGGEEGAASKPREPTWRLARVTGEPKHLALPAEHFAPSPEFPPETVVQAQLQALQQYDFAQTFSLLSPSARALVGPVDRFISSMGRHRAFRMLVHHQGASSMRRCQASRDTFLEVVLVQGPRGKQGLFCWVVTRQASGPQQDCWLTDWVKPIDDPRVLRALGLTPGDGSGGSTGGPNSLS